MSLKKIITILISFFLAFNYCYCQSFVNGDLDGIVNGPSCLPYYWQNVPRSDVNCLAINPGEDTPDLTDINGPGNLSGVKGNPFSGTTFISGLFETVAIVSNNFWHEGIMQTVSGFTIENSYTIRFHQTVVKNNNVLDNSGSWAVYVDTVLVGATAPTYSNEPFGSNSLPWEARSITFTARATNHLIKFLPMDDDSNWVFSNTDTLGALRMGIDSIGFVIPTSLNEQKFNGGFKVFPNPNDGSFKLQYNGIINKPLLLSITDVYGKVLDTIEVSNSFTNYENPSLIPGMYFYTVKQGYEEVGRGKFLVLK
jgi:hypothetical protein